MLVILFVVLNLIKLWFVVILMYFILYRELIGLENFEIILIMLFKKFLFIIIFIFFLNNKYMFC